MKKCFKKCPHIFKLPHRNNYSDDLFIDICCKLLGLKTDGDKMCNYKSLKELKIGEKEIGE